MAELEQKKASISNFNQSPEKVRRVNKKTLTEIKAGLEKYKLLQHGAKYQLRFKTAKIILGFGCAYLVFTKFALKAD